MIGIAALLHKTKDAVKRQEMEKESEKEKMHKMWNLDGLDVYRNRALASL